MNPGSVIAASNAATSRNEPAMQNIPTDLLRTLTAVVDLRSFTKAANSLNITQPAVSSQIRRLQQLLGVDLFIKGVPGVALSETGTRVVSYARRLLEINDHIYGLASKVPESGLVRIGVPIDLYNNTSMFDVMADFRREATQLRLQIAADHSDNLKRAMREGRFDVVITRTEAKPEGVRHFWPEALTWAGRNEQALDPAGAIPLILLGETSLGRRVGTALLEEREIDYEIVFVARTLAAMFCAARAGLGIFACASHFIHGTDLVARVQTRRLPRLPVVYGAIEVRDDLGLPAIDRLVDTLAGVLRAAPRAAMSSLSDGGER
ncbi:MAG: LysR family transcriptional regulator [Proteobacteria bacterium]|nr:LysR family transcriptional regulator [Pseudomonadota bacterium]